MRELLKHREDYRYMHGGQREMMYAYMFACCGERRRNTWGF
jgi:hypothetical protein